MKPIIRAKGRIGLLNQYGVTGCNFTLITDEETGTYFHVISPYAPDIQEGETIQVSGDFDFRLTYDSSRNAELDLYIMNATVVAESVKG